MSLKQGGAFPHTDTQAFYYRYNDRRDVRGSFDGDLLTYSYVEDVVGF